jgi:hypothetical protein
MVPHRFRPAAAHTCVAGIAQVLISGVAGTVDPDARHVHKTVHHRQDGYKAHVAIEPDTGLFTAGELTKATGDGNHEAVVGLALLDDEPAEPGGPAELEVLGDCAYGTGDTRAALADAGHTAVIKPAPLRPAIPGGSPSTTSPSTRPPAPLPARTSSLAGSAAPGSSPSGWPAVAALCVSGALATRPAAA